MKYLSLKNGALLVDSICAFGLSSVALWILLPFTYPIRSLGSCIFLAAAATVAVLIFSIKWWIAPAFISIIVPLTLAAIYFFDSERRFFGEIRSFDPLSASGAATGLIPNTDITDFAIRFVIALVLSGLFFLYFRKLFIFSILPPLLIGAAIYLYILDTNTANDLLPIILFVGFVALSKYQGLRSARLETKRKGQPAHTHMISATLIIPIILFFAVAAAPKEDGKWKSESLNNLVEDISDITRLGSSRATPNGLFDLSISGFAPMSVKLGGDVILNNTPTLYVYTETPIPLAGTYFDAYDGVRWYDRSVLHKYRFNSLVTSSMRKSVFRDGIPSGNKETRDLRSELLREVKLSVNTVIYGRTLFTSGKLQEFSGKSKIEDSSAFFNEQGELFVTKGPYSFMSYDIETLFFDRSAPDFDDNMQRLEQLTSDSDDRFFDQSAHIYLQLPEAMPDSVILLAKEITDGIDSPYLKALAIENWLAENCEYTLTPGDPPENVDFVAHFLQTRKGYCTYYASAMSILARSCGLPARYVNGFLLKRSPIIKVINNYVATNATAHAWTEVYFKGIGWVPFDPLSSDTSEMGIISVPDLSSSDLPENSPTPIPTEDPDRIDPEIVNEAHARNRVLFISISILLIVALIFYATVRAVLLLLKPRALKKRLLAFHPGNTAAVEACYRRILRQYRYLGYSPQPGETISSFLGRIDPVWFDDRSCDVFDAVIRLRFALIDPTEKDLTEMCTYSAHLERRLVRARSLVRYVINRLLFGPI